MTYYICYKCHDEYTDESFVLTGYLPMGFDYTYDTNPQNCRVCNSIGESYYSTSIINLEVLSRMVKNRRSKSINKILNNG